MSHNKKYREIDGYEESLYIATETVDIVEGLYYLIQYGENKEEISKNIKEIKSKINLIETELNL